MVIDGFKTAGSCTEVERPDAVELSVLYHQPPAGPHTDHGCCADHDAGHAYSSALGRRGSGIIPTTSGAVAETCKAGQQGLHAHGAAAAAAAAAATTASLWPAGRSRGATNQQQGVHGTGNNTDNVAHAMAHTQQQAHGAAVEASSTRALAAAGAITAAPGTMQLRQVSGSTASRQQGSPAALAASDGPAATAAAAAAAAAAAGYGDDNQAPCPEAVFQQHLQHVINAMQAAGAAHIKVGSALLHCGLLPTGMVLRLTGRRCLKARLRFTVAAAAAAAADDDSVQQTQQVLQCCMCTAACDSWTAADKHAMEHGGKRTKRATECLRIEGCGTHNINDLCLAIQQQQPGQLQQQQQQQVSSKQPHQQQSRQLDHPTVGSGRAQDWPCQPAAADTSSGEAAVAALQAYQAHALTALTALGQPVALDKAGVLLTHGLLPPGMQLDLVTRRGRTDRHCITRARFVVENHADADASAATRCSAAAAAAAGISYKLKLQCITCGHVCNTFTAADAHAAGQSGKPTNRPSDHLRLVGTQGIKLTEFFNTLQQHSTTQPHQQQAAKQQTAAADAGKGKKRQQQKPPLPQRSKRQVQAAAAAVADSPLRGAIMVSPAGKPRPLSRASCGGGRTRSRPQHRGQQTPAQNQNSGNMGPEAAAAVPEAAAPAAEAAAPGAGAHAARASSRQKRPGGCDAEHPGTRSLSCCPGAAATMPSATDDVAYPSFAEVQANAAAAAAELQRRAHAKRMKLEHDQQQDSTAAAQHAQTRAEHTAHKGHGLQAVDARGNSQQQQQQQQQQVHAGKQQEAPDSVDVWQQQQVHEDEQQRAPDRANEQQQQQHFHVGHQQQAHDSADQEQQHLHADEQQQASDSADEQTLRTTLCEWLETHVTHGALRSQLQQLLGSQTKGDRKLAAQVALSWQASTTVAPAAAAGVYSRNASSAAAAAAGCPGWHWQVLDDFGMPAAITQLLQAASSSSKCCTLLNTCLTAVQQAYTFGAVSASALAAAAAAAACPPDSCGVLFLPHLVLGQLRELVMRMVQLAHICLTYNNNTSSRDFRKVVFKVVAAGAVIVDTLVTGSSSNSSTDGSSAQVAHHLAVMQLDAAVSTCQLLQQLTPLLTPATWRHLRRLVESDVQQWYLTCTQQQGQQQQCGASGMAARAAELLGWLPALHQLLLVLVQAPTAWQILMCQEHTTNTTAAAQQQEGTLAEVMYRITCDIHRLKRMCNVTGQQQQQQQQLLQQQCPVEAQPPGDWLISARHDATHKLADRFSMLFSTASHWLQDNVHRVQQQQQYPAPVPGVIFQECVLLHHVLQALLLPGNCASVVLQQAWASVHQYQGWSLNQDQDKPDKKLPEDQLLEATDDLLQLGGQMFQGLAAAAEQTAEIAANGQAVRHWSTEEVLGCHGCHDCVCEAHEIVRACRWLSQQLQEKMVPQLHIDSVASTDQIVRTSTANTVNADITSKQPPNAQLAAAW